MAAILKAGVNALEAKVSLMRLVGFFNSPDIQAVTKQAGEMIRCDQASTTWPGSSEKEDDAPFFKLDKMDFEIPAEVNRVLVVGPTAAGKTLFVSKRAVDSIFAR